MITFQPVIKWSGSKRSQCNDILLHFPKSIKTYYEPFCGGCSMLMGLMKSGISVQRYVCSDINADLIALWNIVKDCPDEVFNTYSKLRAELCKKDGIAYKKKFFNEQREIYNETHDPLVFFFIMATCMNGLPRYNGSGMFNTSYHLKRNGILPKFLASVLMEWSSYLIKNNVEFRHCSYEEILDEVGKDDFVYLDPPYFNTKGMYFGRIDIGSFFSFLEELSEKQVKFAMSFDGKSGKKDNTYSVPESCYKRHLYIKSGNSSFRRMVGTDKNAVVYESLYLNYDEEKKGLF